MAFSTRRLFIDQDEILFAAARPVILNGIEDIITRPDLADRAILLMLAPITERQRRPENALWREFELARPHILGALLYARGPFIFWIRIYPSVRAWKYKARGIPAGLVQLRPEKMRPVQETRQDPTHPHSVVSQDDERNRSKSGSSSQRATRLSSRVALGLVPSSGK